MACHRRHGSLYNMSNVHVIAPIAVLTLAAVPAAQSPVELRTTAQVARRVVENGRERVVLSPADRVVPGDEVLYTVEVRNPGPGALRAPSFTIAVPDHMTLVPDSPSGPGAEVSFADATHMRFTLHINLRPAAVAFVRYRAVLH